MKKRQKLLTDGRWKLIEPLPARPRRDAANTNGQPKAGERQRMDGGAGMDESRRDFLKTGAKALAVITAGERLQAWGRPGTVLGANDRVRLAIIGLRGRGQEHIQRFGAMPNVEIAALCDIDDSVLQERLLAVQKMGFQPKTYTDIRKLLEDKSIDAVSIATPNHWHTLMSIWACQAGKDVYVEKPCSHNLWEGRQLVRAAAKYDRIVQHGTQSRSIQSVKQAVKEMQEGLLGDVYLARGLCFNWRDTIGHTPVSASSRRRQLRSLDRTGSRLALYQESFPLQLALELELWQWRYWQSRHP